MKRKNWIVGDYGIRPAGSAEHCFYCGMEKGLEHKADCIIRSRTVVVEFKTTLILPEPECFTLKDIEFNLNEGGYCADNILRHLAKIQDYNSCLCQTSEIKVIREATKKDEKKYGVFVNQLPN